MRMRNYRRRHGGGKPRAMDMPDPPIGDTVTVGAPCNGGGASSLTAGCARNSIHPVTLRFASRAERAVAVPGRPVAPVRELAARDIQQLQLLADAGQVPTRFVEHGGLVVAGAAMSRSARD